MKHTALITFSGGNEYTKEKQIRQILKEENEDYGLLCEDYDELDQLVPVLRENNIKKLIILHEDKNIDRFEKAAHLEFDHLFEKIEVLPEQFFRLYEAVPVGVPANAAQAQGQNVVQQPQQQPQQQLTMTLGFPSINFVNAATSMLLVDHNLNVDISDKVKVGLLLDPNQGYWFPYYFKLIYALNPGKDSFKMIANHPENIIWGPLNIAQARFPKIYGNHRTAAQSLNVYSAAKKAWEEAEKDPKKWQTNEAVKKLKNDNLELFEDKKEFCKQLVINCKKAKDFANMSKMRKSEKQDDDENYLNYMGLQKDKETITSNLEKAGFGPLMQTVDYLTRPKNKSGDSEEESQEENKKGNMEDEDIDQLASFIAAGQESVLTILCGDGDDIYKGAKERLK